MKTLKIDSKIDTSNVNSMGGMFQQCTNLVYLEMSDFDTSNVTDMNSVFIRCSKINELDLSNWDTSKVTDMMQMFTNCSSLNSIIVSNKFVINNVEDSRYMFSSSPNLIGGNGTTFDSTKVDATMAHIDTFENPGYFTAQTNLNKK